MLQKTVYKSRAITAAICIVAALLALSVFPLRLWRQRVSFEGTGKPLVMSSSVDTDHQVSQVFVAQYNRIGSFDVYVAKVTGGRYLEAQLQSSYGEILFHRIIDLFEFETPGYVHISAGVDLDVGVQYRLYLKGRFSSFCLGMEPVAANPVPYMGAFFYGYDPDASLRLQMAANYDVPLSKGHSLALMAAFCTAAALLVLVLRTWFSKHPEGDTLLLLSGLVEKVLYTVFGVFYLVLFVLNFPLKRFHDRPGEIAFLAGGIVIAAAVTFYVIRRFCTEPEGEDKMAKKDKAAAVFLALAIAYACEYMNGESNLMHAASERQVLVCLLVVILLSFRTDMLVNRMNVLWTVCSGGWAAFVVWHGALHAQTKEEALQNTVTRCNVLCVVLAGLVVLSAARSIRAKVWKKKRLSPFGIATAILLLVLLVLGATHISALILLVLCTMLYVCVGCNLPAGRFMRILAAGVNINFLLTVGYCLLFRAFQAFIFTRYGMVFPTVAVTGEYLASVTLIITAQLLLRIGKERASGSGKDALRKAWREELLFALAGVYSLLTISRTAYLTIFAGVSVLLAVYVAVYGLRNGTNRPFLAVKRYVSGGCAMLLACLVLFPGVFAMQRILPAMAGHHVAISQLEKDNMIHDLLGSARWDSTYYITALRFWSIFRVRILRQPELVYLDMEDRYNYDEYINPLYTGTGEPVDDSGPSVEEDGEEVVISVFAETNGEGENTVDVSNGRLDIFKIYLSRLSWKGHGVLSTEDPEIIHAHNSYLQVLYTEGMLPGIVFLLWTGAAALLPFVLYYRQAKTHKTKDTETDALLMTGALTVAFATAALTEMNFQLCNPMCLLLFTGILPLIFRKDERA